MATGKASPKVKEIHKEYWTKTAAQEKPVCPIPGTNRTRLMISGGEGTKNVEGR